MAIRFAKGPALGPVFATRPAPPDAGDSPAGPDGLPPAPARTLPEVSASATAAHPDGDSFCVGVAVRVHAHPAASSFRIVGLAAVFAPPGMTLPESAEELAVAELPRGKVTLELMPGPDGIVAEVAESIDVLGLAEGRNDGVIVIAYDDTGYLPTTVEVPTIPA